MLALFPGAQLHRAPASAQGGPASLFPTGDMPFGLQELPKSKSRGLPALQLILISFAFQFHPSAFLEIILKADHIWP